MREIRDPELLEHYLRQYHIRSFFDTRDLPFRLYEYAPGEMITVLRPVEESIKFIVKGVFDHYMILEDGNPYLIAHCNGFGFLGDLAFCGRQPKNRYQEVLETVHAVELPLEPLRRVLENDNRFLRFLIDTMGQRLTISLHQCPSIPQERPYEGVCADDYRRRQTQCLQRAFAGYEKTYAQTGTVA